MCASKSNQTHATAKSTSTLSSRQTRRSNNGNSCGDGDNDDDDTDEDDDDECDAHIDDLGADQDEDVIRAAEEAQEGDLDEAANEAELTVTVTDHEKKVASKALSKVSDIIYLGAQYLLITLYSSQNSRTRSTTRLVSLKRYRCHALPQRLSHSTWLNRLTRVGTQNPT
jgi:hypothetical protein